MQQDAACAMSWKLPVQHQDSTVRRRTIPRGHGRLPMRCQESCLYGTRQRPDNPTQPRTAAYAASGQFGQNIRHEGTVCSRMRDR